ncbi:SmORF protein [Babesia bovis T2Bo]|uniref:SmORF n=1 Tax=Babesia bovis TaxID=5865 RepID=A7AUX1_BABBO|nr:SmORF protein [Babesia bovis T2Bo]EDO06732.1 SmORF protein [Babesia bovis T2Bo]|eukprot:XP_001610300.1 SmORF [Babesia bovis]
MVAFNMLWQLCVAVAFGLSATVTATDVAQEQPKKESLVSRFFGKRDNFTTKSHEKAIPMKTKSQENTDKTDPPKYSLDWYLLPKPENRDALCYILPHDLLDALPEDCNEPIEPPLEKRIRERFSRIEKQQRPTVAMQDFPQLNNDSGTSFFVMQPL